MRSFCANANIDWCISVRVSSSVVLADGAFSSSFSWKLAAAEDMPRQIADTQCAVRMLAASAIAAKWVKPHAIAKKKPRHGIRGNDAKAWDSTIMRSLAGAIFPLFATYMFDGIGIDWWVVNNDNGNNNKTLRTRDTDAKTR